MQVGESESERFVGELGWARIILVRWFGAVRLFPPRPGDGAVEHADANAELVGLGPSDLIVFEPV